MGLLDGVMDFARANPQVLMNFGAGLLSGQGNMDALARGIQGASAGLDYQKKQALADAQRKREEQQRADERAALDAMVNKYNLPQEVAASKTLAQNMILDRFKAANMPAPTPKLQEVYTGQGAQKGYFNNGQWVPVGGVKAQPKPKTTALQQKIQEFINLGHTEADARKLALGAIKTVTNPLSGQTDRADLSAGTITPMARPNQTKPKTSPQAMPKSSETLYGTAGYTFGAENVIKKGIGVTVGQGIPQAVYPKTVAAQNRHDLAVNDLIRALSLNSKYPVREQQKIEALMPARGIISSAEDARVKYSQLDSYLRNRLPQEMELAHDNNMPKEVRSAAAARGAGIKTFLRVLGVPRQNAPATPEGTTKTVINPKTGQRLILKDGQWLMHDGQNWVPYK